MIAKRFHVVVLFAFIATFATLDNARGQDSGARQLTPTEAADQPSQGYSPLDAANDSYQHAEQRRREAIARQVELVEYARQPRVAVPVPYVDVTALPIHPGAARRTLRRAYSRSLRYPHWSGYGAMIGVGSRSPLPYVGAMPYYPPVRQPQGHERIWTGPNSYIYKPIYPEPFYLAPTEATRQPSPPWERSAEPQSQPTFAQPKTPTPTPQLPEPPTAPMPGPQEL